MKLNLALAFAFCALVFASGQSVPSPINYQGRLTDPNGAPTSMANYGIEFRLWDSVTNSSGLIWGQRQNVSVQAGGVFSVVLGAPAGTAITNAVPAVNDLSFAFTSANRFLGLTVVSSNGIAMPGASEILPRQQLLSVPFALMAQNVVLGAITSNQIAPQTIASNQLTVGGIDVTNLAQHVTDALNPPGTVVAFASAIIPTGWILCDGSAISRTTYLRLFSVIGTAWGSGDGSTTFRLPDLRGMFLRGVTGPRADAFADPDATTRLNNYPGGAISNNVGSYQFGELKSHDHNSMVFNDGRRAGDGGGTGPSDAAWFAHWDEGTFPVVRTGPTGGSESRPNNAYVNYIIKY